MNLKLEIEKALPLSYKGIRLDVGYRVDLIVDWRLVVELKCVDRLDGVHLAQILTYMKLTGIRTGLILNFKVPVPKDGIRRVSL